VVVRKEQNMGEVVLHKTRDRVSVMYDRKINIGNYESIGVSCGYSTDLQKEETVEDGFARAEKVASAQLEALCEPIEKETTKKRGK
jgi:hypothetical protein